MKNLKQTGQQLLESRRITINRELDKLSINAIRVLSADAIQKSNSGHPGLPLGAATMASTLWTKMNHNGKNPMASG